jgi:outer membrane murein-binding lipoprotein Lpp
MWQKFKEQLLAVIVTVLLIGGGFIAYAYYVNGNIAEMNAQHQRELADLKEQHATELKAAKDDADQTRQQIAAVNQLLADAIKKKAADVFMTDEEVAKLNEAKVNQLAEAIAAKVQPFNPLPKTPEEAEKIQNEQVDKVSSRMAEKINPILVEMAGDQKLTREKVDEYSRQIADQISNVLTGELAKNQQLNNNLQETQAIARDSLALSQKLSALYLASFKEQGALTRILTLPANVLRDASQMSILSSSERDKQATELTSELASVQKRLDTVQAQNPAK